MKKVKFISIVVCFAVMFIVNSVHADLNLIGQGTSIHGTHNLIYDTDLDITWYDLSVGSNAHDSNNSQILMDWASAFSVDFGGTNYSDWRLPITLQGGCLDYNCTDSEMGHLFYTELGNEGFLDISGNKTDCYLVNCLTNTGDFQNLQATQYWSSTMYNAVPLNRYVFGFDAGVQTYHDMGQGGLLAIAVMDGRPVVPEPISSILFITGGVLLAGRRFFKKIKD